MIVHVTDHCRSGHNNYYESWQRFIEESHQVTMLVVNHYDV